MGPGVSESDILTNAELAMTNKTGDNEIDCPKFEEYPDDTRTINGYSVMQNMSAGDPIYNYGQSVQMRGYPPNHIGPINSGSAPFLINVSVNSPSLFAMQSGISTDMGTGLTGYFWTSGQEGYQSQPYNLPLPSGGIVPDAFHLILSWQGTWYICASHTYTTAWACETKTAQIAGGTTMKVSPNTSVWLEVIWTDPNWYNYYLGLNHFSAFDAKQYASNYVSQQWTQVSSNTYHSCGLKGTYPSGNAMSGSLAYGGQANFHHINTPIRCP